MLWSVSADLDWGGPIVRSTSSRSYGPRRRSVGQVLTFFGNVTSVTFVSTRGSPSLSPSVGIKFLLVGQRLGCLPLSSIFLGLLCVLTDSPEAIQTGIALPVSQGSVLSPLWFQALSLEPSGPAGPKSVQLVLGVQSLCRLGACRVWRRLFLRWRRRYLLQPLSLQLHFWRVSNDSPIMKASLLEWRSGAPC